jgi:hypothetical protein
MAVGTARAAGTLASAPQTAGHTPPLDRSPHPCHGIGLQTEQCVLRALYNESLLLAPGINAQRHRLPLATLARKQHQIDHTPVVLLDGPAAPDQLAGTGGMAGH